jgi:opacity protein-like surface antigen
MIGRSNITQNSFNCCPNSTSLRIVNVASVDRRERTFGARLADLHLRKTGFACCIFRSLFGGEIMKIRGIVLGGLALATTLAMSGQALAQCAVTSATGTVPGFPPGTIAPGSLGLGNMAATTSAIIAADLSNATTAFQAQQGSAFVSAPANPPPNSPGGGIWGRVVGGEVTTKSSSATSTSNFAANGLNQNTAINCTNRVRDTYAGVQIGADAAELNWNGWNLHLGTTAGYLESNSNSKTDAFTSNFQIPFVGTYLVATYGRFFADAMVREEFYNISLNNPALGFFNQPISGRGLSFVANAGYNFDLGNGWFIEPSGGFTFSSTKIDSFTAVGASPTTGAGNSISGTVSTSDIQSDIGRLSLRVGTTAQVGNLALQPFVSASVFHEFAGNINSTFQTCANCNFFGGGGIPFAPATFISSTSTSRIGTYGQYSAGVAGQIVNTGWLGFVRVDYRNGENIDGWAGTGGIRYQFTPEMIAAAMPVKAKARPMAIARPVDWTGFYIGGHGGVGYGRDRIGFVGAVDPAVGVHTAGLLGGGQLGYNYQFANKWVVGLEGDASAANIHGGQTCGGSTGLNAGGFPGGFSPFFMSCNSKLNWLASLTGRLGYAWDRSLLYVKGGAGFANENVTVNCVVGASAVFGIRQCNNQAGALLSSINTSANIVGYTLGFGSEFAFDDHWSAKAEYDYFSFGRRTSLASDGTTSLTSRSDVQVTKVGLNYRFAPGW